MKKHTLYPKLNQALHADKNGFYGVYGGRFVPPVLESRLENLTEFFYQLTGDETFGNELTGYLKHYVGRPSPLYLAANLSADYGSIIYLKREDLNHTGAHKINNAIGQALIAKRMGVKEIVAETGAGQHGVAAATVAALMGMQCTVFMGSEDALRQAPNVARMKLLGARVITTSAGTATLRDAVDAALDYYIGHPDTYYLLGSQVGPHPYPAMVGHFQSVIGKEARAQILERESRLPDAIFASVGGGSNAIGLFGAFLDDEEVSIYGAEGGGKSDRTGETAATLSLGTPIVFHGFRSYCLTDETGEPAPAWSVAAGLDYPGISPQHAALKDAGRVIYKPVYDSLAIEALQLLAAREGIVAAIESSHAVALALQQMKGTGKLAIVNLSGRGDKDIGRGLTGE